MSKAKKNENGDKRNWSYYLVEPSKLIGGESRVSYYMFVKHEKLLRQKGNEDWRVILIQCLVSQNKMELLLDTHGYVSSLMLMYSC